VIDPEEKPFVLTSLERARSEAVFEALEAVYSGVPHHTCSRRAFCCRESPRIYFVEFLNLYRTLMERPRREQIIIQGRSIRYAFLDLCDPTICCPLLEGNRCLLYQARGLRCRLWGHQSRERYDQQISAAKKVMAAFNKLMNRYGLRIPDEILASQSPYCRVVALSSESMTDEGACCLEERLRQLECRFLGTTDPEERYADFSRQLCITFFGLPGYGDMRVRAMREYLERGSEEALQPLLKHARAKTLS
jgi:hypothetical protein